MKLDSLYLDLGTDEVSRLALLADKSLTVDAFAAKYAPLIRAQDAADDCCLERQAAYREAADLWRYLRGQEPGGARA